jgi:hypothetical protein
MTREINKTTMKNRESSISLYFSLFQTNRLAIGLSFIFATWFIFSLIVNSATYLSFGYIFGVFSLAFPFLIFVLILGTRYHVRFFENKSYCLFYTFFGLGTYAFKSGTFNDCSLNYEYDDHQRLYKLVVNDLIKGQVELSCLLPKKRQVLVLMNLPFAKFNNNAL